MGSDDNQPVDNSSAKENRLYFLWSSHLLKGPKKNINDTPKQMMEKKKKKKDKEH